MKPTIGVLALQGDFREHAVSLRSVGVDAREVRLADQLAELDGLIIPGGESTTMARLLLAYDLYEPIQALGQRGFPIWGTCAGAILMADDAPDLDRPSLGLIPMTIDRNAFGRQVNSFETDLYASALGAPSYHAVFIRAPRIRALRDGTEVLMALPAEKNGGGDPASSAEPVAVRCGRMLVTTFHPELTPDPRLHSYFIRECVGAAVEEDAGIG